MTSSGAKRLPFLAKSRQRLLAVLLSGTMLASGACASRSTLRTGNTEFDTEVQNQLDISGGKYTQKQAVKRAFSTQMGKFNYPARRHPQNIRFLFSHCVQTDYSAGQAPKETKDLWENMQTLQNSKTIMGPALGYFSVWANVFYCRQDMAADTGALWRQEDGVVWLTKDKSTSQHAHLLNQAHETIHSIQTSNDGYLDMSWPIREFQMEIMSKEAAARVGETLVALELKHQGTEGPWNETLRQYSAKSAQISKFYDDEMKKNTPYAQALAAAGSAGFYTQFKIQPWLDYYNNSTLEYYIELMSKGLLKPLSGNTYTLERAQKTGKISPQFNFTSGLDKLPSAAERFGTNIRMRQAFDYADLERLARTSGRKNPAYLQQLKQLEKDNNPYLGVDMKQIYANLMHKDNQQRALQIMDCFAGLSACDAGGTAFNPTAYKIKMRP